MMSRQKSSFSLLDLVETPDAFTSASAEEDTQQPTPEQPSEQLAEQPEAVIQFELPDVLGSFTKNVVCTMDESFGNKALLGMQAFIAHCSGVVDLATLCSGSEIAVVGLSDLRDAMQKRYSQLTFDFKHVLSSDICPQVQEWIKTHLNPAQLSSDLTTLCTGTAWDAISKSLMQVRSPNLVICGFSCHDVSFRNPAKKNFLQKLLDLMEWLAEAQRLTTEEEDADPEIGETYKTLRGVLSFIFIFRPECVILENVSGIMNGDLDERISAWLREHGYTVVKQMVDSSAWALPEKRRRLYWFAVRSSLLEPVDQDILETNFSQVSFSHLVPPLSHQCLC